MKHAIAEMNESQQSQIAHNAVHRRSASESVNTLLLLVIGAILSTFFAGSLYEHSPVLANLVLILVVVAAALIISRESINVVLRIKDLVNTFREKKRQT